MLKTCEKCGVTESTARIEQHHVVGRVGLSKDNPENLVYLCTSCHFMWHNHRDKFYEEWMYFYMKTKYGNLFPIIVNGNPYMTKWIARIENEMDGGKR